MKNNSLPFHHASVKANLFRRIILIFLFACIADASFGQDLFEYALFGGKPLNADQTYYSNFTTLSCYGCSDGAITIIYPTFEPSDETVALYASTLWFNKAVDAENYVVYFYLNSTTVGFPTDSVIGTGDSITGLGEGHYWAILIDSSRNQIYRGDWEVDGPDFWFMNGNAGLTDSSFIGSIDSADFNVRSANIERIKVKKTGVINISNLSGGALGLLYADSSGNLMRQDSTSSNPNYPWMTGGNKNIDASSQFVGTKDSTDVVFRANNSEVLRIRANQTVGIGSDTVPAGFKLAVNGKILCEEVKIMPHGNWPDFVFDKDYNLMSLDDLEKIVKEQKHLPNMPSAEAVRKNGINVGDTQEQLLEQQEQLLLYLVQQNKKSEQQNEKIEQQNKKIERLEKMVSELLSAKK